jgi:hypothetical protein
MSSPNGVVPTLDDLLPWAGVDAPDREVAAPDEAPAPLEPAQSSRYVLVLYQVPRHLVYDTITPDLAQLVRDGQPGRCGSRAA